MGTPLGEIFHEHAGGMRDGYAFRGLLPGGASSGFLTEEHFNVPMDFGSVRKAGSSLGTGTMIVLDDKTCPVGMVHNLQEFFAASPAVGVRLAGRACRGSGRSCKPWRMDMAGPRTWRFSRSTPGCSAPATPFASWPRARCCPCARPCKYFPEDFDDHIQQHRCPWR